MKRILVVLLILGITGFINMTMWGQSISVIDTVYTPPGYEDGELLATIHIPTPSNGVGVILTHYWGGTRVKMNVWCDTLAAHGYVAMAIDYYDFSHGVYGFYPKPIRAFKIAVEFLRRNAERFGISTGKIAGLGQSEGAIHWGQTIIWDNDDGYFQTDSTISDRLDAAVLFYGLYDNDNLLTDDVAPLLTKFFSRNPQLRGTKGNSIVNVSNITTPVLLFHGTSDISILSEQSVQMHDSLVAHGKLSQLYTGPWPHLFDVYSTGRFRPLGLIAKDTVLAFLERTVLVTSVPPPETSVAGLPETYALEQNYPNPFNPSTRIEFALPHADYVALKVYNVLGEELGTLVTGEHAAGTFKATWDASGLPSGIYFYRLTAGEYVQTKKMALMR